MKYVRKSKVSKVFIHLEKNRKIALKTITFPNIYFTPINLEILISIEIHTFHTPPGSYFIKKSFHF